MKKILMIVLALPFVTVVSFNESRADSITYYYNQIINEYGVTPTSSYGSVTFTDTGTLDAKLRSRCIL